MLLNAYDPGLTNAPTPQAQQQQVVTTAASTITTTDVPINADPYWRDNVDADVNNAANGGKKGPKLKLDYFDADEHFGKKGKTRGKSSGSRIGHVFGSHQDASSIAVVAGASLRHCSNRFATTPRSHHCVTAPIASLRHRVHIRRLILQ